MLLKFAQSDMLNSSLIDVSSGKTKYVISTRASYAKSTATAAVIVASRTTVITDQRGDVIARIEWSGREKRSGGLIYIADCDPIDVSELFNGGGSVRVL